MKKIIILLIFFLCYAVNSAFANRNITLRPANVERDIIDLDSEEISKQYKGKIKKIRTKDEFRLYEARFYGGFGVRYSFIDKTTLNKGNKSNSQIQAETGQSSIYYDDSNLSFNAQSGFFGSLGLYWGNGLRAELEYSQNKYRIKKLDNLSYNIDNDKVWKYLHNNTTYVNTLPIKELELAIKTVMINSIYEPFRYNSKLTPYIGVGGGLVMADMISLPNTDSAKTWGAQGMLGLSYKMGHSGAMYLGYRYIYSGDLKQTFNTRIVQVSGVSPNYTPHTIVSKETYKYRSNNIDVGLRFFF
jgi:opacity protein-like surface antigen